MIRVTITVESDGIELRLYKKKRDKVFQRILSELKIPSINLVLDKRLR